MLEKVVKDAMRQAPTPKGHVGVPSASVASYAASIFASDGPHVYRGQAPFDGSVHECVAYNTMGALGQLMDKGVDCTTIHIIDWKQASQDVQARYVDECETAHRCATAEAREHYS